MVALTCGFLRRRNWNIGGTTNFGSNSLKIGHYTVTMHDSTDGLGCLGIGERGKTNMTIILTLAGDWQWQTALCYPRKLFGVLASFLLHLAARIVLAKTETILTLSFASKELSCACKMTLLWQISAGFIVATGSSSIVLNCYRMRDHLHTLGSIQGYDALD